jgi:hypothetical protein
VTSCAPADPAAERAPVARRVARAAVPGEPRTLVAPVAGVRGGKTPPPAASPRITPLPEGASPAPLECRPATAAETTSGTGAADPGFPPAAPGRRRAPHTPAGASDTGVSPPAGSRAFLDARLAAKMSEAELEEQIRDACKKLGIIRFHVRVSIGTTPGLPDDILIGSRGILWRECKTQKGKPTPAQVKTGEALRAAGQDWDIWRPADWYSGRIRLELMAIAGLGVAA